jgi:hypothetical protein
MGSIDWAKYEAGYWGVKFPKEYDRWYIVETQHQDYVDGHFFPVPLPRWDWKDQQHCCGSPYRMPFMRYYYCTDRFVILNWRGLPGVGCGGILEYGYGNFPVMYNEWQRACQNYKFPQTHWTDVVIFLAVMLGIYAWFGFALCHC